MRSFDAGETWAVENTDWGPSSATAPCILRRVPESEDLLLIWNNNVQRSDLSSAISRDGGRVWENFRNLEPSEGWPLPRSHQYPSLTFLHGNAHLTYARCTSTRTGGGGDRELARRTAPALDVLSPRLSAAAGRLVL